MKPIHPASSPSPSKAIQVQPPFSSFFDKLQKQRLEVLEARMSLEKQKNDLRTKENLLFQERQELDRLKKANDEELKTIQRIRNQLSNDYSELKYEKFRQKTKKMLLKTIERKISVVSAQVSRQWKLIDKTVSEPALLTVPHTTLALTESVRPINADSDSVPEESPLNTQESFDSL